MASSREKSGRSVCVVGAGPCGLTTLKNLRAAGLDDVVCYDEGEAIGGNWAFDERPERHSVYDATHLISSKRLSEFEDYPMPPHYPDYPSHLHFEIRHAGADGRPASVDPADWLRFP